MRIQKGLSKIVSISIIQPVFEPDVFRIHVQNCTATPVRYCLWFVVLTAVSITFHWGWGGTNSRTNVLPPSIVRVEYFMRFTSFKLCFGYNVSAIL